MKTVRSRTARTALAARGGLAAAAAKAAVLVTLLALAAPGYASPASFHPDLETAAASLSRARGPELYAGLRGVWETWDRADPAHVEEVLRGAEIDRTLAPGARAYAGLLGAYARLRRGDVAAASAKIRALGFVDQWLVVGPFDNDGKAGLETAFGPEADFSSPIVPGRAYSGKQRPVRWRKAPAAFPFGYLDAGSLVRPDRKICVYATSFVSSNKAPRDMSVWVGASGSFKAFWNGQPVLSDAVDRRYDADRTAARVRLEKGTNSLTLKVCGDESAPVVSARLADARGEPDPSLEATSTLEASVAAAETAQKTAARAKSKAPLGRTPTLEGPVQAFDRLARVGKPRPKDLEAFARYLVATGGDDLVSHQARNLADRAAEAEPTVERLLLAAELAEDRNQRARFIERAESLSGANRSVRVILARAALIRESLNAREAFPLYDEVLRRNPDDVSALRGEIEMYNDAGLRRTALATVERAVARNPRSVVLLNMHASQLRALGRTAEAAEVESRYFALRFDDRTLLSRFVELGLARRSREATERWVERLLSIEPDGQWALGTAARAYRALGESDRAVATYRRALEIAPEDIGSLRALADLEGEIGNRSEQLALLGKVLEIAPQDKDVREYVEHLEPKGSRLDESFAWHEDRFGKLRHLPPRGQNQRTLLDLTVTTVFENGLSSKFRQIVFQPLSDAAAALARQYAFQYQADSERVQLRGARVFRGDGSVDESIESGEGAADDPTIAMYTSARTFYVQFPRLERGDVVELRYRIDSMSVENRLADYFGEVVYLQSSEPVAHAEYVLVTPATRKVHFDSARVPGLKSATEERGPLRIHRFFADAIPGVAPEPAMPPWSSLLGYVHASTYATWKDLGKWYWGFVREQFDLDDQTKRLARDITRGKETTLEKVRAVYDWVVTNTRYVALEFGIYGYKPRRCVQTVARGWGDCKDKATVIVTLLKELGIESTIVIVRTGLRGDFDSKIASLAPFDHAIAYVPELDLYLDGTAEYTGSSELPALDAGALALRVNEGNPELVRLPLPDPEKNVRRREITVTVRKDGSADLEIGVDVAGTSAASFRRRLQAESTRRDRLTEEFGSEFTGFELAKGPAGVQVGALALEQPVSMKVRGAATRLARQEGPNLSLVVTLGFRLGPSFATLSARRLPLKLPPLGTLEDEFVVKLPPGMGVVSGPVAARGDTPFGSFAVSSSVDAGRIVVRSRLTIKMVDIAPKDYAGWRQFTADADAALTPRLVIGPP